MKKLVILAAFAALLAALVAAAALAPTIRLREAPLESLDALMEAYHDRGRRLGIDGPFNGVILVADGDTVLFHEAYGSADAAGEIPLTTDARFLIGSVSKQFTAMLVLQQVDRGTIGLDQSVTELVDWFPADPGDALTIRALLSHTAGLPHYTGLRDVGYTRDGFYNETLTPREYAELIAQMPLLYAPGDDFVYSSFGYVLLGVVLEEVTGKSYADLLHDDIAEPLALYDTGYAGNAFVAEHVVPDYEFDDYGVLRLMVMAGRGILEPAEFRDQSTTYSAGGIHSTAADLLRWTQALRNNELLSADLARQMTQPNRWGYGYGVFRNPENLLRENPNATLVADGGQVASYSAFVGMYDDGTTVITLANVAPLDMEEIVHHAYLAATGEELVKEPIHPSLRSLRKFDEEGGVAAFVDYHRVLSERAGYSICPNDGTLAQVVNMHLGHDRFDDAQTATAAFVDSCAPLDEDLLNSTGYVFLRNDRIDEAVRILRRNAELHPLTANMHDSLGEALEESGELDAARASYARAVELGRTNDDPALPVYERNLARID